ncbi:DUF2490 domain-containing protein [Leeuwenhoekiella sp. W20_SRS_FM14]|uniref:DUF2490 domain-containing protein n=1 Tax=Leeuwenhoekiella sp. W20_SRS_FM14 TaxID=3240270 RepID=UPI003F9E3709
MSKFKIALLAILFYSFSNSATLYAQVGNSELGAWYSYFFSTGLGESGFGVMGDVQHRNYKVTSDFQQLILRAGLTYKIKETPLKLVAGYSYFNSGTPGEDNSQTIENRYYQDLIWSQKIGSRISFNHRIRFEERFIQNQDFRTRYRYALNVRAPLNNKELVPNALYLWAAGEVFINGQKQTGSGTVNLYDRTWLFSGLGYEINKPLRLELAYMREVINTATKGQLIMSLFHNF